MEFNLENKNVLVIGASKGIGRAISEILAKERCNLVLVARSKQLLEETRSVCVKNGSQSVSIEACDILCLDLNVFCKQLTLKYGVFDAIIHCVGTSLVSRNIFGGEKDYYESLRINALHAIEINSQLIPLMIEKSKRGHIVHVSSISAKTLRGNPLYASAKSFLNAYVKSAGRELASKGICLNSVMPGAVSFDGSYWDEKVKNNDPAVADFLKHHQAIGRFGNPEEIAWLVAFLVSEKSSFICGSNLEIDGGNM